MVFTLLVIENLIVLMCVYIVIGECMLVAEGVSILKQDGDLWKYFLINPNLS